MKSSEFWGVAGSPNMSEVLGRCGDLACCGYLFRIKQALSGILHNSEMLFGYYPYYRGVDELQGILKEIAFEDSMNTTPDRFIDSEL